MLTSFFTSLSNYHFLQNALITAVAIGIVAGVIGCFIILRGMSLMGDAISHAVLPGEPCLISSAFIFLSGRSSLGSWLP